MNTKRNSSYPHLHKVIPVMAGLAGFVAIWHLLSNLYEPFILPSPAEVAERYRVLLDNHQPLARHFWITCFEALAGFTLAVITALPLSYYMYRHPFLDQLLTPFVVGIQAVPIVALAPLLVIWFGFGITSKILIAALVAFFPIVTNGLVGLKETDPRLRELLQIMGASRRDIFFKLEVPSSLPVLFGGLKVGMTLSVIGAVVGEFSGAGKGLGYLVNLARGNFDTPLIFIGLIALAGLGLGFYLILSLLEQIFMPWKKKSML
ncbi:MAG TPA: ABC transporter permease [Bacillota bacterium]|nr:ABC transporter permease [Bacillota bacterium]HPT87212.1 ABC transporter permease [Bacillota bacterium]